MRVASIILICADCEGTRPQIQSLWHAFERRRIVANFFFTGQTARAEQDLVRDIAQTHSVGSHTYSHVNLRQLDKNGQRAEIVRGRDAVESAAGRRTMGFRAPYHAINRETVDVLNEEGFRYDVSGLYYRYDMRSVREVRPSWFREWTELYGWLHLPPRVGWDIPRVLFRLFDPLVLPAHPHYSGSSEAWTDGMERFIGFAIDRGARFMAIPDYLDLDAPQPADPPPQRETPDV